MKNSSLKINTENIFLHYETKASFILFFFFVFFLNHNSFSQGNRLWASYYGGTENEEGYNVATDPQGNVYVVGTTESLNRIATAGAYQTSYGGNADAFIVKFNSAGVRQWGTYFGGPGTEWGYAVATDALGNVYLGGATNNDTGISFNGFQNSFAGNWDAFLVKFNSSGARQWATYYGGPDTDGQSVVSVATDNLGNVYLAGGTSSASNIASGGAQNTYGSGGGDGFLVKFNTAGARLWASYLGDVAYDAVNCVATDIATGDIYVAGQTGSNSNIATVGAHQTVYNGITDAFLTKFNTGGSILWSTYYGGTGSDIGRSVSADGMGNVYLAGNTTSPSAIASGGIQNNYIPTQNAFLVKFNAASGTRSWGTYYGKGGGEEVFSVVADSTCTVYLAGDTYSRRGMAKGGYQDSIPRPFGVENLFVAKFDGNGNIMCATYYGHTHEEDGHVAIDKNGNVYLAGDTYWPADISSGGHQNNIGGNYDAFLVKFSTCSTVFSSTTTQTNNLCYGDCKGTATAEPQCSYGPFTYLWNNGQTTQTATGLCIGAYTVTIWDRINNSTSSVVNITQPSLLTSSVTSTTNVRCFGESNGAASTNVSGGTSGYTYNWSNTTTNSSVSNFIAGNYSCTITDANGCISTTNVSITQPPLFTASDTTLSHVDCFGKNNGAASIMASGGTSAYNYSWNNGATTALATNFSAAAYTCTITDANGCSLTRNIIITQPSALTMTLSSTPTSCDNNSGSAGVMASGGTPGYIYSWSNIQTTMSSSGLTIGTYTCIVTDQNGCTITQSTSVAQTSGPAVKAIASLAYIQSGGSSQLSAVSDGTAYLWVPATGLSCVTCANPIASPTESTHYCVLVTDENGCTDADCVSIDIDFECDDVYFPNAFSPNGDGENEIFIARGNNVEEFTIMIYDRWGEKVFESHNILIGWDGTYRGSILDPNVFTFQATYACNSEIKRKFGNISLVR